MLSLSAGNNLSFLLEEHSSPSSELRYDAHFVRKKLSEIPLAPI